MPWFLNCCYLLLVLAAAPVLVYRRIVYGKYRDGWAEKLWGQAPLRNPERPCLWFHAVSVGEVLQLETVVARLEADLPGIDFVISTTTSTGRGVAEKLFSQHTICYFPLDFSWSVRRALVRVRPTAVILVELELWPNFIQAARRQGIPVALINGRLSERSYRGYFRIRWLTGRLLQCLSAIAVQNDQYRQRFLALGAPADRLQVTGSIKFDRIETDRQNPQTRELAAVFGLHSDDCVFVAGSTQAPEEQFAFETWLELQTEFPKLRLILVPRHMERFDEAARLVESQGIPLIRRSRLAVNGREAAGARLRPAGLAGALPPVLLLDTLGELAACWGLADVAFVGGSLTNRGGQNMIEPAAYGAAVLFGPNTQNFHETVEALLSRRGARVVYDRQDLTAAVREFLADRKQAAALGRAAQEFVLSQQGATERTVSMIHRMMSNQPLPGGGRLSRAA